MDYKLVRSRRRTLSVQIIDKKLIVRSPYLLPKFYIEKFLEEKRDWIEKTLNQSANRPKLEANQLFYLGKKRRLEFGQNQCISEDVICLKALGQTKLERKKALEKFLHQQAKVMVCGYLQKYQNHKYRSLKFSYYLSKWGSCSAKNDLTFNIKLSMCPPEVIEYVVVHELCHIQIKNHSRVFWSKVGSIMPEYKKCRKWLRDHRWYI